MPEQKEKTPPIQKIIQLLDKIKDQEDIDKLLILVLDKVPNENLNESFIKIQTEVVARMNEEKKELQLKVNKFQNFIDDITGTVG